MCSWACSCGSPLRDAFFVEQRVEPARPMQCVQIVAATNMSRAHENLRHGGAPISALDHLAALLRIAAHVDFHELDPLADEECLGGMAKATKAGGVDFDLCHRCARCQIQKSSSPFIWEGEPQPQPGQRSVR